MGASPTSSRPNRRARGDASKQVTQPRGLARDVREENLVRLTAVERSGTTQHLEQNQTHGVQIGAAVDLFTGGLLRRHVTRGSDRDAPAREFERGTVGQLGDPEVEELRRPVVRDEDVRGFDVTMDDADVVSGGQTFQNLGGQAQGIQ